MSRTSDDPAGGCLSTLFACALVLGFCYAVDSCNAADCADRCAVDDRAARMVGDINSECWCVEPDGSAFLPTTK